jgi:hypothetical protein
MPKRTVVALCLLLFAAASNPAESPLVIRTEGPRLISAPDGDWIRKQTTDFYFILQFKVDVAGRATDVSVLDRGFATKDQIRAATEHVEGYRFKPGTRDGQPVATTLRQTFALSHGKSMVSPQFREESRKVVGLINAGDHAGARHHAEWMLSEVVRSPDEYLGLQGTLAQAFASAGDLPSAMMAVRSATARAKAAPKLVLGAPIPRNVGANYQFNNSSYIANLLDLRLRLAVQQGFFTEALLAYRDLAGLIPVKPDSPMIPLAAQLTAALQADAPLVAKVELVRRAADLPSGWGHILWRRQFSLDGVQGRVTSMDLTCGDQTRELVYEEGVEWSVPESWEDCSVYIHGDEGTELRIVEFVDDKGPR